ncbi:virion structural protein [Klebsiella phage vB_KpM_FBKp24]|uniref:Virion structural protein n=1 Tax=Klebsiella phage vB_KpM_FBKp24 TaxID=2801834 RepID=A0A7U0GBF0_9CAUD|nr:virion structural protein [Klebsiella phage vB_KpM_FBKp24]QQV92085.1 virion structural protein [Klebsiella phage vB_KpM_FBKp24]
MSASTNTNLIARTALSGLLQTHLLPGLSITKLAYTTLNERLSINADAQIATTDRPAFGYYCIGDKGHYNVPAADNEIIIEPAQHTAADFGPFNMIPFVMRLETNDLSASERANYALRKLENLNGVNYFSYYLKKIDLSAAKPTLRHTVVIDGESTTTEFVPNSSNLFPTRPTLTSAQATTTNSEYLTASMEVDVPFDENDVAELNNVASILYGSQKRAIISEIGLVSAIQRSVQATGPGGAQINMVEAIYAQVLTWLSTYRQLSFDNQGFVITLEMGANEPMLTSNSVTTASTTSGITATIKSLA